MIKHFIMYMAMDMAIRIEIIKSKYVNDTLKTIKYYKVSN